MRKALVYFACCFFVLIVNIAIALYPAERLLIKTYWCATYTAERLGTINFPDWMQSQQLLSQKALIELIREECKN